MGRWQPRDFGLTRADDDPEQAPDPDEDPPAVHYQQQITRLEQEHRYPETGPDRKRAIERELTYWRTQLEREQRGEHWRAGEGDRTLF